LRDDRAATGRRVQTMSRWHAAPERIFLRFQDACGIADVDPRMGEVPIRTCQKLRELHTEMQAAPAPFPVEIVHREMLAWFGRMADAAERVLGAIASDDPRRIDDALLILDAILGTGDEAARAQKTIVPRLLLGSEAD
jgi:hypothetical protein